MKRVSLLAVIGVVTLAGIWGMESVQRSSASSMEYHLPHDNFSPATEASITAKLAQYDVAQTPLRHEVYRLTGGLGEADPLVVFWDAGGNMTFQLGGDNQETVALKETSQSPRTWRTSVASVPSGVSLPPLHQVPWVRHVTPAGNVYFQWNEAKGREVFYFLRGRTYVTLTLVFIHSAQFPRGIFTHLEPVGNPVMLDRAR